jgi:hypothetical protein
MQNQQSVSTWTETVARRIYPSAFTSPDAAPGADMKEKENRREDGVNTGT